MYDETPLYEFRGPWGVPVQIGPSIVFLALIFVSFSSDPVDLYYNVIFLGLVVISIYLHELGHAWGCLVQGVAVRRVMIYGGGGFCEHARPASAREDELIVAMGPLVNLAVWAIAGLATPLMVDGDLAWAVQTLSWLNLYLAIFNMIPVMPLDGGRLFHLCMLRLFPGPIALRVAGGVGLLCALAWIPLMLFSFFAFGMVLLFIPPLLMHWRMLTGRLA
ncbi:MAG: site-2 protease family protein [Pseudomonadota bacterium]